MDNLVLSSSTLIGTDVKNSQGENLGTVKDVMIDMEAGKVVYLVLSFGGFLGIGDKYLAIPLELFKVDEADERLTLNMDKQKLESAPGFDKDSWPTVGQNEFLDEVYNYYGFGNYSGKVSEYANPNFDTNRNAYLNNASKNSVRSCDYNDMDYNGSFPDNYNNRKSVPDETTRNRDLDPDRNRSGF